MYCLLLISVIVMIHLSLNILCCYFVRCYCLVIMLNEYVLSTLPTKHALSCDMTKQTNRHAGAQ